MIKKLKKFFHNIYSYLNLNSKKLAKNTHRNSPQKYRRARQAGTEKIVETARPRSRRAKFPREDWRKAGDRGRFAREFFPAPNGCPPVHNRPAIE
jgi:hypothetical protein